MGRLNRIAFGRGTPVAQSLPSPAEGAERSRAAVEAHEARMRARAESSGAEGDAIARIEAAVEDGVRRLQEAADRLAAELERAHRPRAEHHPASRHLAEEPNGTGAEPPGPAS